jgi:hypothetical protein
VRSVLRTLLRDDLPAGRSDRDLEGRVDVLMALFDGLMIRSLRHPDINKSQVTRVLRATIQHLLAR